MLYETDTGTCIALIKTMMSAEMFAWLFSLTPHPQYPNLSSLLCICLSCCVSDPGFFQDPDWIFFSESGSGSAENPDPKKRPKTVSTSKKLAYFIFSTLNTVLFGQVPPNPNKKHHLDLIGSKKWFVNGRIWIRIFKVRIRIGEKIRINPDLDQRKILDPSGSGSEPLVSGV